MYRSFLFLALAGIVLTGCIEQIELYEGNTTPLVVSGEVTNEEKVQRVRLLYLEGYNVAPDFTKVRDAAVHIVDEDGNEAPLIYVGYGFFETADPYAGEVGKAYHIDIRFDDGRNYQSVPDVMLPVPEIEEISYNSNGSVINFTVDYTDTESVENFYRWRFEGVYEVFSPYADPRSRGFSLPRGNCSPAYAYPFSETCWVTDIDEEFLKIEDDELYDGMSREDIEIYSVVVDRKFDLGYSAAIKQYSLSPGAFRFWSEIENQLGNTGSIFETSNYQIVGNVKSINNPEESVLGYFTVSAVSTKRVFVEQFLGLFPPQDCSANLAGCRPVVCLDCRSYSQSSTDRMPEFWPR